MVLQQQLRLRDPTMSGSLRIPGDDSNEAGAGKMSQLSYWHIKWAIPAAVVNVAARIGGGWSKQQIMRGLEALSNTSVSWVSELAQELATNPVLLDSILYEIRNGMRPDPQLVGKILSSIRREER